MAFRLNRTVNRKPAPKLEHLVKQSPLLSVMHRGAQGKPNTLTDAAKEKSEFMVSVNLVKRAIVVIALGFAIVGGIYWSSMHRDDQLVLSRLAENRSREKVEGVLLTQKRSESKSS